MKRVDSKRNGTNIQIILDGLNLTPKQIDLVRTAVQRAALSELAAIDNEGELHIQQMNRKSIALEVKYSGGETQGMLIRQKLP